MRAAPTPRQRAGARRLVALALLSALVVLAGPAPVEAAAPAAEPPPPGPGDPVRAAAVLDALRALDGSAARLGR